MKSIEHDMEIERLKHFAGDFLSSYFGVNITKNFKCILPSHQDKTPSMSYEKSTFKAHCFACGKCLDLFDMIGLYFGIEGFAGQLEKAQSIYGAAGFQPHKPPPKPSGEKDLTRFYNSCRQAVYKTDYFYRRGLSLRLIEKYGLGYDEGSDYPYIIPVTNSFYIARSKEENCQRKTLNSKGVSVKILNKDYLFSDNIVFVVEGWADALSIEEVGGKAISLNGAGNARLISCEQNITAKLVIMGDNDEAGKRLNEALSHQLNGLDYCVDFLPNEYHDANDMLVKNRLGLSEFVNKKRSFMGLSLDINLLDADSLFSSEVIDFYVSISDYIEKTKLRVKLTSKAKEFKLGTAFEKFIKPYDKMSGKKASNKLTVQLPLELNFGDWMVSDSGVYKPSENGLECAATHPIIISKRLINKETKCEKVELTFYKDKTWEKVIVDKVLISDRRSIVGLASRGVSVTSETAKTLINYLFDLQAFNCDIIPLEYSISRLGWTADERFSPYYEGIVFDGEMEYGKIYKAIRSEGELSKWLDIAKNTMDKSLVVRLFIMASLASPILKKMNLPIFFTHLWGETEVGKTVAMMLAMSVWGDPKILTRTHNSTNVALEKLASFFNNVPLVE